MTGRWKGRPESAGDPSVLPPEVQSAIAGYAAVPVTHGCSGAEVFRLTRPGARGLYLKAGPREAESELRAEWRRLEWIGGRLPVPEVVLRTEDAEREYLLVTEISGRDASDPAHRNDLPRLARLLAEGLRLVHSLLAADCPFDMSLDRQFEAAYRRLRAGLVDESDFDECRRGRRPEELWEELLRTRLTVHERVFTHGDYCLPNVILAEGRLSGFIDWGRAGVADPYQDLSLAARSLEHNFSRELVGRLFSEYGIDAPDWERVEFYKLLDEFF